MIKATTLTATLLVAIMFLLSASAHSLPAAPEPLSQTQRETIQELLGSRFTQSDIERLLEHIRSSASIPADLRRRLRATVSDLRLEYGFQMAVLLARWKKAVPQLGAVDLDDLFKQIDRALDD